MLHSASDTDLLSTIAEDETESDSSTNSNLNGLEAEFDNFTYTDYNSHTQVSEIDPDNNFFDNTNIDCQYYTVSKFNNNINVANKISLIHLNSRSLPANFDSIQTYLNEFNNPFNIIAITESWLKPHNESDYSIDGYEMFSVTRSNKDQGGVVLYVDSNLCCKKVIELSRAVDDLFECVSVEIILEKKKNIIISCIYREPGTNADDFKEWMEKFYSTHTNYKDLILCGDYNIDLLKAQSHKATGEFIDAMFAMSLFPSIIRPSRITSHSATLIDNIFCNNLGNIVSGLLIKDISDHLPVFAVYNITHNKNSSIKETRYIRVRDEYSMTAFKNDLASYNWDCVYREQDIDVAYKTFLDTFTHLYNKHCPLVKHRPTGKKTCKSLVNKWADQRQQKEKSSV